MIALQLLAQWIFRLWVYVNVTGAGDTYFHSLKKCTEYNVFFTEMQLKIQCCFLGALFSKFSEYIINITTVENENDEVCD